MNHAPLKKACCLVVVSALAIPRLAVAQVGAAPSVTPLVVSGAPISSRDRVYAANQTSNIVSVIDPSGPGDGKLLGEIVLGALRTEVLRPIYRGQLNVHGLGFSSDHHTLVVVSIGSNSVMFIDTATNAVEGTAYIGRAPHEAFFTPDGRDVWAAVRGEDYLSVIDAVTFKETSRITVARRPGMTLFRPNGRVAFVVSSFTPEVNVVDVATKKVLSRIPVVSPFSPDLFVSADGHELWMTHKDVGKVTVIDARAYKVRQVIDTGPLTNMSRSWISPACWPPFPPALFPTAFGRRTIRHACMLVSRTATAFRSSTSPSGKRSRPSQSDRRPRRWSTSRVLCPTAREPRTWRHWASRNARWSSHARRRVGPRVAVWSSSGPSG